jgi:succinate-acetate transporter protein
MTAGAPGGNGSIAAEQVVQVTLRPLGSPLPLGFFAFGTGTMLLTALELQWVPATQQHAMAVLMLTFVAPLELFAALMAFPARDAGAGTALGMFGGAWVAVGVSLLGAPPASHTATLATFMFTITVMIGAMAIATISGKPVFALLLTLAAVRYLLTGLYEASGSIGFEHASGWVGLPIGLFSVYGGLALLLEDARQRIVLPIGRRGASRTSLEGELRDQFVGLEQEAGVRRQL